MNDGEIKQTNENTSEEDDVMNATAESARPCSITESIIQSCKEIKLMQEGKLQKRSWDDFAKKMRQEIEEDEEK